MGAMNKKAIFFTMMAMMIAAIIVLAFTSDTYLTYKTKIPVVKTRVQLADDYVKNLKYSYLDRAVYSSSYAALNALNVYINQSNSYVSTENDFKLRFTELLINGTIDKNPVTYSGQDLMANRTLLFYLNRISDLSRDSMMITTNFSNHGFNVKIGQSNLTGPWKVNVNASFNFSVNAGIVSWNDTINKTVIFSIEGLYDPTYVVNRDSDANRINKTDFISWSVSSLSKHITQRTYRQDKLAPSFIQRFYGNFLPSECCGIESFPSSPSGNKRSVDYCYFDAACQTNPPYPLYTVSGLLPAGYLFNAQDIANYDVDDEASVAWNPP